MPASAKLEFLGEELAALYDSLSEEEKELAWLNFEQTTELFGIGGPATRRKQFRWAIEDVLGADELNQRQRT